MPRRTRTSSWRTIMIGVAMTALLAGPATVTGHDPFPAGASLTRSADVAPVLSGDGTFHGAAGVAGTVDTSAWTLVSDLAAGAPPRFARATSAASPAAAGPWSALGSNGAGNGALNNSVQALAVSGTDL